MIILVTGGRDYTDLATVYGTLDVIKPTLIIHGDARGADSLAQLWSELQGVPTKRYPVSAEAWERYKSFAGGMRNQKMLDENPDIQVVVAFPGGPGTRDMINRAKAQNFNVIRIGQHE
jgi:hypothetical protein